MASLTIRPGDTFVASGINDLPIISTSSLINLMESACTSVLIEFFEPGETTSTSEVGFTYLGGIGVGNEIRAHATCIKIVGALISFKAEVHHETRIIAGATIERKLVDRVTFMARTAAEGFISAKIG